MMEKSTTKSNEMNQQNTIPIQDETSIQEGPDTTNERNPATLFCKLCNLQLINDFDMGSHLQGKVHKKNEQQVRIDKKCCIYIRGFSGKPIAKHILPYFSQFGKIVWSHFGHDFVLLDYSEPTAVKRVMARKNHFLDGHKLFIKHRINMQNRVPANKSDEINPSVIIAKIRDITGFDNQAIALKENVQSDLCTSFPIYNKICEDIHMAVCPMHPAANIHPFGSTVTGLGFTNSDIDIFISNIREPKTGEGVCLKMIQRLLYRSRKFANIIVISAAKTPILKCVHIDTGINCDINVKNLLGVCNSQLIKYYLSIDPKVKILMIVLKFWAKVHKITGQSHLLTNYSLCMMLIFYLQQKPYEFPSVLSLQENLKIANYQEGWNGGFEPNYNFNSEVCIKTPILNLLEGFFTFYGEFNYNRDIICPYLGKIVEQADFNNPDQLPDYYSQYKKYLVNDGSVPLKVGTSICLQDPFEHCRNNLACIRDQTLTEFVSYCKLGKQICKEGGNIMHRLLTENPINPGKLVYTLQPNYLQFSIPLSVNLSYLEYKLKDNQNNHTLLHAAWFDTVVEFSKIVLRDFLDLNVSDKNDYSSSSKHKKDEGQLDVHDKLKVAFICCGKINLWDGRKSTAKEIDLKMFDNIIDKEKAVTCRMKEFYKNVEDVEDIIKFEISLISRDNEVFFDIRKIDAYKKSFKTFSLFILGNLQKWFDSYEKDLRKNAEQEKKTVSV